MRRERLIAALVLCLAATACGPKRASMAGANATADVKPESWKKSLGHWTRGQKVYDHLETRLLVNATWECGAFADAYADEYARRYVLNDQAREEFRKRQEADAQSYHTFFMSAYTVEGRWNDFSKRDSIWRVRLYDDKGASVEPLVINKVKDDDPVLHEFFPYFTLWTRGYILKFPKDGLSPDSKTLKLQLTSAIGAAELSYDRAGAETPKMERATVPETVGAAAPAPVAAPVPPAVQ